MRTIANMKKKEIKAEYAPVETLTPESEQTETVVTEQTSEGKTAVQTAPMLETYQEMSPARLVARRFFRSLRVMHCVRRAGMFLLLD